MSLCLKFLLLTLVLSGHDPSLNLKSTMVENLVNFGVYLLSFFYGSSAFGIVIHVAVAKESFAGAWELIFTHLCRLAEGRYCHGARRTVSHVNGSHHISVRLPLLIQVSPQESMGHLIEWWCVNGVKHFRNVTNHGYWLLSEPQRHSKQVVQHVWALNIVLITNLTHAHEGLHYC